MAKGRKSKPNVLRVASSNANRRRLQDIQTYNPNPLRYQNNLYRLRAPVPTAAPRPLPKQAPRAQSLRRLSVVAATGLALAQDRRRFHPSGFPQQINGVPSYRLAHARSTAPAVRARQPRKAVATQAIAFADPQRMAICVRRQTRREVIHAIGKAGGRVRRPRLNAFSGVYC